MSKKDGRHHFSCMYHVHSGISPTIQQTEKFLSDPIDISDVRPAFLLLSL